MLNHVIFPAPPCSYTLSSVQRLVHIERKRSGTFTVAKYIGPDDALLRSSPLASPRDAPSRPSSRHDVPRRSSVGGTSPRSGHRPSMSPFLIAYAHPNAADIGNMVHDAVALVERIGCHVLLWEYRGYGMCEGSPSEEEILIDMESVMDFIVGADLCAYIAQYPKTDVPPPPLHREGIAVAGLGLSPNQVILMGMSIGGGPSTQMAAALCAAAKRCHAPVLLPAALILVATFTSLRAAAHSIAERVASRLTSAIHSAVNSVVTERFDNLTAMKSVTCPVLVIHGTLDDIVPYEQGQALFDAAVESRFGSVQGGGGMQKVGTLEHCGDVWMSTMENYGHNDMPPRNIARSVLQFMLNALDIPGDAFLLPGWLQGRDISTAVEAYESNGGSIAATMNSSTNGVNPLDAAISARLCRMVSSPRCDYTALTSEARVLQQRDRRNVAALLTVRAVSFMHYASVQWATLLSAVHGAPPWLSAIVRYDTDAEAMVSAFVDLTSAVFQPLRLDVQQRDVQERDVLERDMQERDVPTVRRDVGIEVALPAACHAVFCEALLRQARETADERQVAPPLPLTPNETEKLQLNIERSVMCLIPQRAWDLVFRVLTQALNPTTAPTVKSSSTPPPWSDLVQEPLAPSENLSEVSMQLHDLLEAMVCMPPSDSPSTLGLRFAAEMNNHVSRPCQKPLWYTAIERCQKLRAEIARLTSASLENISDAELRSQTCFIVSPRGTAACSLLLVPPREHLKTDCSMM